MFIILGSIAAVVALAVILELTGVTDFVNNRRAHHYETTPSTPNRTISDQNKGEESGSSGDNKSQSNNLQPGDDKSDQTIDNSDANLITPSGSFVSNHHTPAGQLVQSACSTTPGATCQIIFKNGSATKWLPAQPTDRGGSTYWSWKPSEIGLTAGSWDVTAKAVLGDQTKTAADSMKLEVQ